MIDYKTLTHDDLDNMSLRELLEIPVGFLEENYHDIYLELYCRVDDSAIMFEDEYPYVNTPDRIFFEVFPEKSGKRIILYLKKINNKYFECNKVSAHYILEQVFDDNNQIVSEVIKENPHCNL